MERCQITSECYRKSISGHSGHFRPAPANFSKFCLFKNVEISAVFAVTGIKRKIMSDYWLIFKHRFYMGKTKIFKRHFFTTYIFKIIWTFLANLKSVCTMVILIIRILSMLCILHTIENLYLRFSIVILTKHMSFWLG